MARYFFDLHNGDRPLIDHEGMELPSRETVRWQVTRILVDVARDEMPTEDRAIISVKVRNEASEVISVATLTFASEWFG